MVDDALLGKVWGFQLKNALDNPYHNLRRQRIFSAFNAITDAVVAFSEKDFKKQILRCDLKKITGHIRGAKQVSVETREDFFSVFLQAFSLGKAMEIPSHNPALFQWFEGSFSKNIRMGGQAGIISNQLACLDCGNVCYSPILSKSQSALFNQSRISFPSLIHGRLAYQKPQGAFKEGDPTKVNWIFEFRKGDRLRFGQREIIAPRANRLIVASRPGKYLPMFPDDFEPHLGQFAHSFDVFFLAGFQSFQKRMGGIHFRHYLRRLNWQLAQLKNSRHGKFHLEYVAIHDPELDRAIYPTILHNFDSLGINEVETVHFLKRIGDYPHAHELERSETPMNFYKGLRHIFHRFKLKRLHAHTLGYFLLLLRKDYVGRRSPQEFVSSLLFASRVADARAFYGKPPTHADIKKFSALKISKEGLFAMKSFAFEMFGATEKGRNFELTGIMDAGDHFLLMVPTAIVKPKATVGLGDTISSVAFASEPF